MSKYVVARPSIKIGDDSWENLKSMLDGFIIHFYGRKKLDEQELALWHRHEKTALEHYKREKGISICVRNGTLWYGREEDFIP
ncbi:hypothetical protein COT94_02395 [Candidatus Falkowbacteria bacterium CG10_big_fil_rev_8_21_14_0_10_37_14]|uniref:Uncharacterized protein n=1 Tax=Candidatus Falkowbacteria bacterium CG10_big_fil_rev_8_21_14_0_10_37_14 TaxID=1974561 RepID=A0A2M6WTF9_9BACT|nr:hypothetical protein [Candidatus Falkowbacteria bacterium]PIT96089.1 MAG: hypothetical protein COT94_02395 [Candidatus Falkowbacteria bacterium CG10_big_fil_rev_8_21_14_0_10_37_14]